MEIPNESVSAKAAAAIVFTSSITKKSGTSEFFDYRFQKYR
jgi:hypothetical protein